MAKKEKPITNKTFLLQKYPGKGGWIYAVIEGIPKTERKGLVWLKVKGKIDDYSFSGYKLMPLANGDLFLPVKAEIRKKIGKEAGDWVKITLYLDYSPFVIPDEIELCFLRKKLQHGIFSQVCVKVNNVYTWIGSLQPKKWRQGPTA